LRSRIPILCFVSITVAMSLLLAATHVSAQRATWEYGWTLSASNADPFVNTAPVGVGVQTIFLWLNCGGPGNPDVPGDDGMSAAAFDLVFSNPAAIPLSFTSMSGFLNAGGVTSLLLVIGGCPAGPVVAGSLMFAAAPTEVSFAPVGAGKTGTVDCNGAPDIWPIDWVGFSSTGGLAPSGGLSSLNGGGDGDATTCEAGPVSVDSRTWGGMKSLYR